MINAAASAHYKVMILFGLMSALLSCSGKKKIYKSDCDDGRDFKRISFTHLVDSITSYDKQYVEITGTFKQGSNESALFDDSLYMGKPAKALWVEFSPSCPLFLDGTRIGFFDYDHNNGQLTPVNDKVITIRGEINCHNRGYLKAYKASIEHISYIKL